MIQIEEAEPFMWADNLGVEFAMPKQAMCGCGQHMTMVIVTFKPSQFYKELVTNAPIMALMVHPIVLNKLDEVTESLLDIDLKTDEGEGVAKRHLATLIMNEEIHAKLEAKKAQGNGQAEAKRD